MDDSHALDWHSTNTQSTCIAIAHSRDKIRGSSGRATTAASKHRQHQQQQQKARAWRVPTIVPTCSPQKTHISRAMVLWSVLKRVPGSEGTKVGCSLECVSARSGRVDFFSRRRRSLRHHSRYLPYPLSLHSNTPHQNHTQQVLVGTTFLLGVGSVPFFYKRRA